MYFFILYYTILYYTILYYITFLLHCMILNHIILYYIYMIFMYVRKYWKRDRGKHVHVTLEYLSQFLRHGLGEVSADGLRTLAIMMQDILANSKFPSLQRLAKNSIPLFNGGMSNFWAKIIDIIGFIGNVMINQWFTTRRGTPAFSGLFLVKICGKPGLLDQHHLPRIFEWRLSGWENSAMAQRWIAAKGDACGGATYYMLSSLSSIFYLHV